MDLDVKELVQQLRLAAAERCDVLLDRFVERYSDCYEFGGEVYKRLLNTIHQHRLSRDEFWASLSDHSVRVMQCARLLLRESKLQSHVLANRAFLETLCLRFVQISEQHFRECAEPVLAEVLTAMCSIMKNLAKREDARPLLLQLGVQRGLLALLQAEDSVVMQTAVAALTNLAPKGQLVGAVDMSALLESLLHMTQHYDASIKVLSLQLLQIVCADKSVLTEALQLGAVGVAFRLLNSGLDAQLTRAATRFLAALTRVSLGVKSVRSVGGVPLLASLISQDTVRTDAYTLVCICAVVTNISTDRDNSLAFRGANGIFLLGKLLEEHPWGDAGSNPHQIVEHVFRAMRFLYAAERNRAVFRRMLPSSLFGLFIDVGPYVYELSSYELVAREMLQMSPSMRESFSAMLASTDLSRRPKERTVGDYVLVDLVGQGAFGSVWEARLASGDERRFAVKEITLDTGVDADKIAGEVSILSKLDHANIVRFYESFRFGRQQYIVMEFVSGVSLQEFITTFSDKKQSVPADIAWSIFVQLCSALRYLHADKQIVHRDLKPANIMVDAQYTVKLADFGLASEQRHGEMNSVVGTISYCCPEIVRHQPYTAKADVWSLGCVLYQLLSNRAPFVGENAFHVISRISEGAYAPLPTDVPESLRALVSRMLTVDASARPDMDQVVATIAPMLMQQYDKLCVQNQQLQTQLALVEAEKRRFEDEALRARSQMSRLFTPRRDSARPSARGSASRPLSSVVIPTDRLRPVDDPLSVYMNQLNKLLFVEHLPPDGGRSYNRRLVNRFARELFGARSVRYDLKSEIEKLVRGSSDTVAVDVGNVLGTASAPVSGSVASMPSASVLAAGVAGPSSMALPGGAAPAASGAAVSGAADSSAGDAEQVTSRASSASSRPTYAELKRRIEECLQEAGYYSMPHVTGASAALPVLADGVVSDALQAYALTPSSLPPVSGLGSSGAGAEIRRGVVTGAGAGGAGGTAYGHVALLPQQAHVQPQAQQMQSADAMRRVSTPPANRASGRMQRSHSAPRPPPTTPLRPSTHQSDGGPPIAGPSPSPSLPSTPPSPSPAPRLHPGVVAARS